MNAPVADPARARRRALVRCVLAVVGCGIAAGCLLFQVVAFVEASQRVARLDQQVEELRREGDILEEQSRCLQQLVDVRTPDLDLCKVAHP